VKLARVGWFMKGVVYALAGVLAIWLAASALGWSTPTANEASPTGAVEEVSKAGSGPVLLWVLAIGLFLYALWRLVTALLPAENDASTVAHRVGYLVSAGMYAFLGWLAIRFAMHTETAASSNGNQKVTGLTQRFMDNTLGRWAVGILGVVLIAVGLYRIAKGVRIDVDDELDLGDMSRERRNILQWMGAIGEVGRGLALALVGFFLLRAGWTYNANEATGLDGALRRLAEHGWGIALVALVGIGFLAYGLFCCLTFHRRRLEAP
jgi:Domain of Unknown Function (DUF1206)